MTEEFNIRDFRNAGNSKDAEAEQSNRVFYSCMVAIPVIAVVAGLAYKPIMEFRGKNVAAAAQAEAQIEAKRRASNPLYALKTAPRDENGLIDPNTMFGSNPGPSPERKLQNEYARRPLNANEFLNLVDAKISNFTPLELETLKYTRTTWALTTCSHGDLRDFYIRQNEAQYKKFQAILDEAVAAKREKAAAQQKKQAEKAEKHYDQMRNIKTQGQAIAFVASGGAGRHMDAVGGSFSSMSAMIGDSGKYKIKNRRQRFNQRGCSQVRTIVQSGTMRIKPNVKLK